MGQGPVHGQERLRGQRHVCPALVVLADWTEDVDGNGEREGADDSCAGGARD